jgi:hypothetical protein
MPGDLEDPADAEVALRSRRGADGVRLVREADMDAAAIHRAVDGDALDAGLTRRSEDPAGDLAAVGDEDLAERGPTLSHEIASANRPSLCRSTPSFAARPTAGSPDAG